VDEDQADLWTLDELVQRAADAIDAGQVRAPNGRVTALPDRRIVRWYTTIGLVDRPVAFRGRTALYGPRHLLQVVAVKRRQAEGRSLAEIQAELTGATDTTLRSAANPTNNTTSTVRPRFWADRPAPPRSSTFPLYGVPLHRDATLLLPAEPTAADLAAIQAAAQPLLDLLAARGLLTETEPMP
jgi:DNA-binding transcriptional MerR regulator